MLTSIVSVGKNNEIGKKNQLILHDSLDFAYFKKQTKNKQCVMGRKTYESIPLVKNEKLPGRKILVISRNKFEVTKNAKVLTLEEFLKYYQTQRNEEIMICGGASIYETLLPYTNKLLITRFDYSDKEADTFFPEIDPTQWKLQSSEQASELVKFEVYVKKPLIFS